MRKTHSSSPLGSVRTSAPSASRPRRNTSLSLDGDSSVVMRSMLARGVTDAAQRPVQRSVDNRAGCARRQRELSAPMC